MNELLKLEESIRAEFPAAELSVDKKVFGPQFGWLDIEFEGRSIAVEWRAGEGFGVSLNPDYTTSMVGLFDGPDDVFSDLAAARDHVLRLLEEEPLSTGAEFRRVALA